MKSKLKGNTIIEVLIALAIISVCMTLASLIYLNIQKSSLPFVKLKGIELAEKYMNDCVANKSYHDETFNNDAFVIKKFVSRHEVYADCMVVRLLVFDRSQKLVYETQLSVFNGS